jgi:hypothetical protein
MLFSYNGTYAYGIAQENSCIKMASTTQVRKAWSLHFTALDTCCSSTRWTSAENEREKPFDGRGNGRDPVWPADVDAGGGDTETVTLKTRTSPSPSCQACKTPTRQRTAGLARRCFLRRRRVRQAGDGGAVARRGPRLARYETWRSKSPRKGKINEIAHGVGHGPVGTFPARTAISVHVELDMICRFSYARTSFGRFISLGQRFPVNQTLVARSIVFLMVKKHWSYWPKIYRYWHAWLSTTTPANGTPSNILCVILYHAFQIMFQTLSLEICFSVKLHD